MSSDNKNNESRGGWRDFFWPIYRGETAIFLPMALMISGILFNYTMARGIKDALVVNEGGAILTTFLKTWGVVPAALIFFMLYNWLSNVLPRRSVFYAVILPFLAFFGLFGAVLYPYHDSLHPIEWINSYVATLPEGALRNWLDNFFNMGRYWTFSLYYIMAELWGSAVLSLLFWQFANDIIPVIKAKRFYAHFYLVGNVAVILAGQAQSLANSYASSYSAALQIQTAIFMVVGASVVALYYYLNNSVLTRPEFQVESDAPKAGKKKKKPKMSLGESVRFLFSSRYLLLIAMLVVSYGVSINLIEVQWKELLKTYYAGDKSAYQNFMGNYLSFTGFFTILAILIGGSVLRRFGWTMTAMATPILIGITGAIFYGFLLAFDVSNQDALILGVPVLLLAVIVGTVQNLLSKPTKYAMFDPTKEMSYIPLDDESKMKGKAAVDVVGARLGKSGGAVLNQGLDAFAGGVLLFTPYAFAVTVLIVGLWIISVQALGKRFHALTGDENI